MAGENCVPRHNVEVTARFKIDTAERRRRVAVRSRLAPAYRGSDITNVASDLVCLHATDPTSVYLGAFARVGAKAAPANQSASRLSAAQKQKLDEGIEQIWSAVQLTGVEAKLF